MPKQLRNTDTQKNTDESTDTDPPSLIILQSNRQYQRKYLLDLLFTRPIVALDINMVQQKNMFPLIPANEIGKRLRGHTNQF